MPTPDSIRDVYVAFNDRAIDTVLAGLAPDVEWPNGWEGGRIAGREQVREYWLRQWGEVDPRVDPVEVARDEDGRWRVLVHQVVRSPDGKLLGDEHVQHVYTYAGELVTRMDIEPPPAA